MLFDLVAHTPVTQQCALDEEAVAQTRVPAVEPAVMCLTFGCVQPFTLFRALYAFGIAVRLIPFSFLFF